MRLLVVAALAFALAGCAASDGKAMHFQEIQCQDNPWGAGADRAAIADHYDVEVLSAKEVDDGFGYADVCGGPSSMHIGAIVIGDVSAMKADGWQEGEVTVQ